MSFFVIALHDYYPNPFYHSKLKVIFTLRSWQLTKAYRAALCAFSQAKIEITSIAKVSTVYSVSDK